MRIRCLLAFFLFPSALVAQGTQADFDRQAKLGPRFAGKVTRDQVRPTWFADGTKFWYANILGIGKREYVVVDCIRGTRQIVDKPPTKSVKEARELEPVGPQRGSASSPDGRWSVEMIESNVVLRDVKANADTKLTADGKPGDAYNRVFWAPDSKAFIALKTKVGGDRKVTLVESSPKAQLQPKTSTYDYLKPGDPIPWTKPHLFDVATKKEFPVSDELFSNPWEIGREHWAPDGQRFYFLYNQRGHTVMRVNAIDVATGKVTAVVNEECKTFFDYANKTFLHHLDATDELIWMSERNGVSVAGFFAASCPRPQIA